MTPPPVPPLPKIPEELRNVEFLRTLAGNPAGRKQLEQIVEYLINLRSALLCHGVVCNHVIENIEEALGVTPSGTPTSSGGVH